MASPVRVLHVVVNMNRGGAETLLMNLYRNIDRSKVQFDFLTCKSGVFDKEIESLGGRIHRIPYITEAGHFGYVKYLKQFFREHATYSIVHSHMDKMSGLVLREAKRANIPMRIAHSHSTKSEGNAVSKLYKSYIANYIQSNATHYFACSKSASDWLFKDLSKKAFILNNGIDIDLFSFSNQTRNSIRKEWGLNDNTFVIGHVGRFSSVKNHLFIIDLFDEFLQREPSAVLILAGDGPLKEKVLKKVNGLKLSDNVILLGVQDNINEWLQVFDVFVFPSLYEGLPLTLIEAQTSGLPCLVSDTITQEADIGVNLVYRLPLDNKAAWVEQLTILSNTNLTRDINRQAFYEKGYDIKLTGKQMEQTYTRLREQVT